VTVTITLTGCTGTEGPLTAQLVSVGVTGNPDNNFVGSPVTLTKSGCTFTSPAPLVGSTCCSKYKVRIGGLPPTFSSSSSVLLNTLLSFGATCHGQVCGRFALLPICNCLTIGYWKNHGWCAAGGCRGANCGDTDNAIIAGGSFPVGNFQVVSTASSPGHATACPIVTWILSKGDIGSGNSGTNIVWSLAAQYVAAMLNTRAGTCTTFSLGLSASPVAPFCNSVSGLGTTSNITPWLQCAELLLSNAAVAFNCNTATTTCSFSSTLATNNPIIAAFQYMNTQLNSYNNKLLCSSGGLVSESCA
jgi:hypothetical protein